MEDADAACRKLAGMGVQRLADQPTTGANFQQYPEVKHLGPDGVCADISEHGWLGAKGLEPAAGEASRAY